MALDDATVRSLFAQLTSHAATLGVFDRVATHEPKNAPGNGLSLVFWAQQIQPVRSLSGLNETTARLEIRARIYTNMLQEPQDAIDPNMVAAAATLMSEYSGNFELGGIVYAVDLLGSHGEGLTAQAGYINQDQRMFRVMEIVLPLIIDNAFAHAA